MLVISLKYASANEINKELRILTSKDGELVPVSRTNQIIITDWVSNLYRITNLLKEIDVKVEKKVEKKSHSRDFARRNERGSRSIVCDR